MTKPTNTSIGPNTRVNGRIVGDTTVDVYGYVRGEVDLRDTLTVHEEGIVDGEVAVDNLVVNGTVRGQLHVRNHLVLTSTARVVATIRTHLFTVEDGARFSGDIETHIGTSDAAKPLAYAGNNRRSTARSTTRSASAVTSGTFQRSSFIRPNETKETAPAQPLYATEKSEETSEATAESHLETASTAAAMAYGSEAHAAGQTHHVVVEEAPATNDADESEGYHAENQDDSPLEETHESTSENDEDLKKKKLISRKKGRRSFQRNFQGRLKRKKSKKK